MTGPELAHDLLLLVQSLEGIKNAERLLDLFVGALDARLEGVSVTHRGSAADCLGTGIPIATAEQEFGWLDLRGDLSELGSDPLAIVHNTASILAMILLNRNQAQSLASERKHLDTLVRKRTRELAEQEKTFRQLVEATHAVPWELDLATLRFTYIGPQLVELLGYTPEDWPDFDAWAGCLHPDDRDHAIRHCQRETDKRKDHDFEYRVITKSGQVVWIHDVVSVVSGPEGPEKLVGFLIDITQKKTAEQQLRQSQKMEAIGTLAGGIAHDFNNILGAVIGYTELTLAQALPGSETEENLTEVLKAAHRAKDLTWQILSFSRSEVKSRASIRPATVVREASKMLAATIPKTIDYQVEIAAEEAAMVGDTTQIHQLVVNLCTNAYQAMKITGGQLRVQVATEDVDRVRADLDPNLGVGPHVVIRVTDTGPGMTPDIVARIFEPFFTTKGVGEGTGLGLSVVHGIVKSHGGAIQVESRLGVGTTFTVLFPRADREEQGQPDDPPEPRLESKGTICFVDDDPALAKLGRRILENEGYRVASFTDAQSALRSIEADPERFDLVITDQTMPDLTGAELILRILELRSQMPTILCTGHSDVIDQPGATRLGVSAFVSKPLSREDLLRAVAIAQSTE